ncbi:hypothetical protein, partial [Salmonella enterica]
HSTLTMVVRIIFDGHSTTKFISTLYSLYVCWLNTEFWRSSLGAFW